MHQFFILYKKLKIERKQKKFQYLLKKKVTFEQSWPSFADTGIPPLAQFFGTQKNCIKGTPHFRRTIFVLKWENRTFEIPKSTFCAKVHYIFIKSVNIKPISQ
jgi:hypothetical protein